ncbi:DEAD/DEAH box helicase, partial [Klebsiella pneumoniae]|uniref:DEAD/DEAH box helicase n=1 Tax=Klebsiella pneumoniae TaxID=573 RepID=UPI001AD850CC
RAQAKTGSGKTAAFGLGLLQHIDAGHFMTQALVLCPTRELADQVAGELRRLARYLPNIKILTLCGGVPFGAQRDSLIHPPHIIVATPGRLIDHLNKDTLHLDAIRTLVLDEADRMLDMGFIHDIRRVIKKLPVKRQNLLFSATFSNGIKSLANTILNNPVTVEVSPRNSASQQVTQFVHLVDKKRKAELLAHLIGRDNW